MAPASVRLPVDALLRASGAHKAVGRARDGRQLGAIPAPYTSLARIIGVRPRSIHRWEREGGIPLHSADVAAIRCGLHPSEVWANWWSACFEQERIEEPARRREAMRCRERAEIVSGYQQIERWRDREVAA